jgi:hypothetical protein
VDAAKGDTTAQQALAAKYEAEMAEVVKSSNEKYNQMLIEQLQLQEALRKDHLAEIASQREDLANTYEQELEEAIGKIRATLNGDKESALIQLRRDSESKIDQAATLSRQQIDQISAELMERSKELSNRDNIIVDLKARIEAMTKDLSASLGDKNIVVSALERELATAKGDLDASLDTLQLRNEEIDKQIAALSKCEADLLAANMHIAALTRQLEALGHKGSEAESLLQGKLKQSQTEADSFRQEINQVPSIV